MLHFQGSFIIFLCFTVKSEVLPKLNNEIAENIDYNTSDDDDNHILNVTFNDSKRYNISAIYLHQNGVDSISKEYAFHSALNCKFAEWTVNKIYDFVKWSPLFYQHKFERYDIANFESAFKFDFQISLNTLITILDNHLGRFINILNNFLDTNSNKLYYYDTSVLDTLVSIKININYVLLENPYVNRSQYVHIIRFFVKEMMKLQSVLSLNCKDISVNHNNSQFYGYWISVDEVEDNKKGIDVFFSHVKRIKLESDNYSDCKSTSVLFTLSQANFITIDISESFVKDDRQNIVSFTEIMDHIRISYDTELIYLYQNIILTLTMKLIFTKVRKLLKILVLPPFIEGLIKVIHSKINNDRTNFPVYVADGFSVLNNLLTKNLSNQISDIKNYLFAIRKNKYKIILLERMGYTMTDYLTETLSNILENIEYLKCFQQYHKVLRIKYEKNYVLPIIKDENSLISRRFSTLQLDTNHNELVCSFILNIYSMCYEALMLFQEEFRPFYGSKSFTEKSIDMFERIQLYFFIIIRQPERDIHLLNMALKITPIIVAMTQAFGNDLTVAAMKRITNVIMNELNINGINYCSSARKNLLLFNSINYLKFGNYELIESSILQFFQKTYPNFIRSDLAMSCKEFTEYKYFDVDNIFSELIRDTFVYKKYKKHILVYWKGQKKNLYQIYKDISIVTFNPYTLYSFYDIIYTFFIAFFYDVVMAVLKQKQTHKFKNVFNEFTSDDFPRRLWPLISDIKSLYSDSVMNNKNKFMASKKDIDKMFENFNFVFVKKPKKSCKFDTFIAVFFCFNIKDLKASIAEIKLNLVPYGNFQKYLWKNFISSDINIA